jgi:iron complex outermembrane receptor protein
MQGKGLAWLLVLTLVPTPLRSSPALNGGQPQYELKLERQPLDTALQEFARQSGVQIIFFSQLTDGLEAPALQGQFTADAALERLLRGSRLTFRALNTRTIEIRPRVLLAVASALKQTSVPLVTDHSRGDGMSAALSSQAAGDSGASAGVVVTGTRVQARTRLDTLAPVDVLSARTLTRHGSTELAQVLSVVAPSLDFPHPAITDGTDHIRPVTLRGLSPDQTLVLVNSKRRHASALVNVNGSIGRGSAAVDLNAIPVAAIERVEILRDGASAQYGSDAIAGVINIKLREAREGGESWVTYGEYDTDVRTARGNRTEHDGGALTTSVWTGLPLGPRGFLTLTGEFRDNDPTSRGDFDNRIPPLRQATLTSRYGEPRVKDKTLYANAGGVPIGSDWQLYGWAGYQQRNGESAAIPRLADDPNNVPAIYPNGFLPLITSDIEDLAAAWGARGTLAGWSADTSVVYGRNRIALGVENSINSTFGAASPTQFDAGAMTYDQLVLDGGLVRGFDWGLVDPANVAVGVEARRESYAIDAGDPASYARGPLTTPMLIPGAQGFPGFRPDNVVDVHRMAYSAYADLETQLTPKWLASVALRGEHYSDFGSRVTGKLSVRHDFTRAFAVRSTVSTGFRAPGLQQEHFTSTALNLIDGVPFEVGTFPAAAAISRALGARPLKPESSHNYSLGLVLRPNSSLEATVDAYRIDVFERIVLSENLGGQPGIDALIQPLGVGRARFFLNGVDTRTRGMDLVLRYRPAADMPGRLDLIVSGNWNTAEVTRLPTIGLLSSLDPPPVLFGRINTLTFEEGTPRSKINAAADWSYPLPPAQIGVDLRVTRYGPAVEPGTDPTRDLRISSTTLVDLELRANVGNHFTAALGVDNLFDQYPEPYPSALNPTGAVGFSRYSPFGFDGRFGYARLGWRW